MFLSYIRVCVCDYFCLYFKRGGASVRKNVTLKAPLFFSPLNSTPSVDHNLYQTLPKSPPTRLSDFQCLSLTPVPPPGFTLSLSFPKSPPPGSLELPPGPAPAETLRSRVVYLLRSSSYTRSCTQTLSLLYPLLKYILQYRLKNQLCKHLKKLLQIQVTFTVIIKLHFLFKKIP